MSTTDQNMGIKADKAHESPSVSAPKVAPTAGGVTAPGVSHTPGPWKAERVGDTDFRAPDKDDFKIVAENLMCPGTVWSFGAEGEANARLIAAAPALVEALKCCVDELVVTARIRNVPCRAEELARAALASAAP